MKKKRICININLNEKQVKDSYPSRQLNNLQVATGSAILPIRVLCLTVNWLCMEMLHMYTSQWLRMLEKGLYVFPVHNPQLYICITVFSNISLCTLNNVTVIGHNKFTFQHYQWILLHNLRPQFTYSNGISYLFTTASFLRSQY